MASIVHLLHDPMSNVLAWSIEGLREGKVENLDWKSTRLNSSHQIISYAVFCLKKKKKLKERLESKEQIDDQRHKLLNSELCLMYKNVLLTKNVRYCCDQLLKHAEDAMSQKDKD